MVKSPLILVKPQSKMAHSVTTATTRKVRPRAEKLNLLRKVIKNPKPPSSIMWTSWMAEISK